MRESILRRVLGVGSYLPLAATAAPTSPPAESTYLYGNKIQRKSLICIGKVKLPGVLDLPLLHLVDDQPVLAGHHHLPHVSLPDLKDIL